MQNSNRVLVIGLDGATWDVLDPWMRDGTLPHLAALRARGSWGTLQSSIPPITAAAWSTFMTGKRPAKHGVFHFVRLFEDGGSHNGNENGGGAAAEPPEVVSARSLRSATLWDILGHHGRRVGMVNIPLTYPPRPVNGFMVTGLLTPRNARVFTYPTELSETITDYAIDLDRFADKTPYMDEIDGEIVAPTLALVQEFRDMLEMRRRVTVELLESRPWDFFMIVFMGTDRMGHYLWRFHRNPAGDGIDAQLCAGVRDYYVRLDEIVGELVERAGKDAVTLIMSDHGMGAKYTRRFHVNAWLRAQGWLQAVGSPRGGGAAGLLSRLGIPRDRVGRLLRMIPGLTRSRLVQRAASAEAARIDAQRSAAYAIPMFNHIFGIRINAQGAERDRLYGAIEFALRQVVNPRTGKPLVERVVRGEEYYQGPYAERVPDMIVMLDPDCAGGYRLGNYSAFITELQEHSGRGNHRMEGVFVASGPGIAARAEPLPGLNIEDVTPTVLYLMGLPVPSDLDGRALTEVVAPERRNAQPVVTGGPVGLWPNSREAVYYEEPTSAEDQEEILDRLQALGYLE